MATVTAYRLREPVTRLVIRPSGKTRLCLPADYANNKLFRWNQEVTASGWSVQGNPYADFVRYGVGSVIINSGSQVKLHRVGYTVVWDTVSWNDLVGFSIDTVNHMFSIQFILDNDKEETLDFSSYTEGADGSPLIYDDDESFWTAIGIGSGTVQVPTLSEELTEVKKGTSSLKVTVNTTGGSYAGWAIYHDYATSQDWSSYDFLCLYWYGANSGTTIRIYIPAPDGANQFYYDLIDNWTGWKRLVIPLRAFSTYGSPSWSNVTAIDIRSQADPADATYYLDRTLVDVGQWAVVEIFVPDVLKNDSYGFSLYSWNGSEYAIFLAYNPYNTDDIGTTGWHNLVFLDGTTSLDIYPGEGYMIHGRGEVGSRGETISGVRMQNASYSSYYGCRRRLGFALKLPPDDGQDASDYGISQCKLKLEVYYSEDESRRIVYDSSGYGNNGTIYGGPTSVDGRFGRALYFDGDDWVDVAPGSNILNLREKVTVCTWIKISSTPPGYVFAYGSGFWPHLQLGLGLSGLQNYTEIETETSFTNLYGSTVPLNQWTFIAVTYDASTGDLKLYKDGQFDASTTHSGKLWEANSFKVGSKYDATFNFIGCVDEVRVYNRVLSENEIRQLYEGVNITDGLVLHLKLDEEIYYGSATYEFEDSTNQYYGLQNINEQWLALFNPDDDELEFYCFEKRPTYISVRADENEIVREVIVDFPKPTIIYKGKVTGVDFSEDKDGNGVPDVFETYFPYLEEFVSEKEVTVA